MTLYDFLFYLFAALTLISGFIVVTSKNIVYSAFSLLFTFCGVAGLYVLLGADFLSIVQIMVYVGGILILIMFGVMLTNKVTSVEIKTGTVQTLPAALAAGVLGGVLISSLVKTPWKTFPGEIPMKTLSELGRYLITDYSLIFELLGILLLVALIGAATLARKN
jgi:NADH-quinone oxidoreductase subunit J